MDAFKQKSFFHTFVYTTSTGVTDSRFNLIKLKFDALISSRSLLYICTSLYMNNKNILVYLN